MVRGHCFKNTISIVVPQVTPANGNFLHCFILPFLYWEPVNDVEPGPEVINLLSCSTQLSKKFQLLIKTKIPTNEDVSCFKSLRCCI